MPSFKTVKILIINALNSFDWMLFDRLCIGFGYHDLPQII